MQLYPLHGCMGSSKGHNTALTGSFLFVAWSIQEKLTVIPSQAYVCVGREPFFVLWTHGRYGYLSVSWGLGTDLMWPGRGLTKQVS